MVLWIKGNAELRDIQDRWRRVVTSSQAVMKCMNSRFVYPSQ